MRLSKTLVLAFWAAVVILGFSGCASTADNENASVRPWNAPKTWETGIPSSMTEGR
jgi:hypothetical protein